MNKFNKKLTISVPQQSNPIQIYTHENQSPSIQQSAINDKQGLLQFHEYRDGVDSQYGDLRNQAQNRSSKINFVQFQEFNLGSYHYENKSKDRQRDREKQKQKDKQKDRKGQDNRNLHANTKRNVFIQVPDRDEQRIQDRKLKINSTTNNNNSNRLTDNYPYTGYQQQKFKQPPAPSKGSKLNKVFVFPVTPPIKNKQLIISSTTPINMDKQKEIINKDKDMDKSKQKQKQKDKDKDKQKIKQLQRQKQKQKQKQKSSSTTNPAASAQSNQFQLQNIQTTRQKQQIQQLKRSFEKQRQQFYKQKSKLQKQILIKNGQIQMLHKLLTQNFTLPSSYSYSHHAHPHNVNLNNSLRIPSSKNQYYQQHQQQQSQQELQAILLQKDIQINELLQKIVELNSILSRKSDEYAKKILQISSAQSLIQSLKNQLYIYERKDQSQKLTKKFFHLQNREKSKQHQRERQRERQRQRQREKQRQRDLHNRQRDLLRQRQRPREQIEQFIMTGNKQFGSKGLENLYKRIQMVRMNRIEFDSRNKIRSDISYSQTTKNRPKGTFDFKGKTFQGNSSNNNNKSKLY